MSDTVRIGYYDIKIFDLHNRQQGKFTCDYTSDSCVIPQSCHNKRYVLSKSRTHEVMQADAAHASLRQTVDRQTSENLGGSCGGGGHQGSTRARRRLRFPCTFCHVSVTMANNDDMNGSHKMSECKVSVRYSATGYSRLIKSSE